jgi:3-oxoacyl-[acyl-carrier protein] reductase
MLDLSGLKVAVTGGSRGIGRSIALAFAANGAAVSICARGEAALRATEQELRAGGRKAHAAICDLGDGGAIARYIDAAAAALGGLDVLVSNATGVMDSEDSWKSCLDIDLMAAVRSAEAALPHLERSTRASIINIASISGLRPSASGPAYAAAKAALMHFTTSQALALAPKRIRANGIAPGSIDFPGGFWDKCKQSDPTLYGEILESIPMGRYGTPEEIANVALFLASPLASWVTGHTIVADGGQVLSR